MNVFMSRVLPVLLLTVVLGAVAAAITWSVVASAKLPVGPADVVWDKAACAACGMHVGEPPFAAQATTKDGRVHAFDDPGCLFLWQEEQRPELHSVFFRHHREDRWIARDRVGFVAVTPTPMGFGFGAVDANTPGAIDLDTCRQRVLARTSGHGGQ
jgi:copper chaperone NosL